jgi:hypothetical protein
MIKTAQKYWVNHATATRLHNLNFYSNIDLISKFSPIRENYLGSIIQTKFNLSIVTGKNLPLHSSFLGAAQSNLFSTDLPSKIDFSENKSYRNYILANYSNHEVLFLESNLLKLSRSHSTELSVFSSSHESTNINFLRKERSNTKLGRVWSR